MHHRSRQWLAKSHNDACGFVPRASDEFLLRADRCSRDDELHSRGWWKKFQNGIAIILSERRIYVYIRRCWSLRRHYILSVREARCSVIKIKYIISGLMYTLSSLELSRCFNNDPASLLTQSPFFFLAGRPTEDRPSVKATLRDGVLLTNGIVNRVSRLSALRRHLHRRQCRRIAPAGTYNALVTLRRTGELHQPAGISLRLIFREYKVSGERENAKWESNRVETRKVSSRVLVIMQSATKQRAQLSRFSSLSFSLTSIADPDSFVHTIAIYSAASLLLLEPRSTYTRVGSSYRPEVGLLYIEDIALPRRSNEAVRKTYGRS